MTDAGLSHARRSRCETNAGVIYARSRAPDTYAPLTDTHRCLRDAFPGFGYTLRNRRETYADLTHTQRIVVALMLVSPIPTRCRCDTNAGLPIPTAWP